MTLTTLMPKPGIVKDNSEYATEGAYIDGDKVRFRAVDGKGYPETLGGWERASADQMTGIARAIHPWQDNDGNRYIAVATHRKLYVWRSSLLWDITPVADGDLGADPVDTTDGSSTVTITDTAHGAVEGAYAYLTGLTDTGGLTIGGGSGTYATDPFTMVEGSTVVRVAHPSHGLSDGEFVTISSVSGAINGVPDTELNTRHSIYVTTTGEYLIEVDTAATATGAGGGTPGWAAWKAYEVQSVTSADAYTIDAGANATSTASGGGAGGDVIYELNPGLENSTLQRGYGTGGYGLGAYGSSNNRSDYQARTWSLDNLGEWLVTCPRGGSIYRWQNNRSQRAAVNAATDAPTQVGFMLVTPEGFLVAFGCHNGTDFNPKRVKWATQSGGFTSGDWTAAATNTARDQIIGKGSEIVAAVASPFVTVIWTDASMQQMRYQADTTFVYGFDGLGDVGLIGPNAWAKVGDNGAVFWISPSWQFWMWANGTPQALPCPNRDWMRDQITTGVQQAKIFASGNQLNTEVWWLFPGSSTECDTYLFYQVKEGVWSLGTFDRSAMADAGVLSFPMMAGTDGYLYYHDKGDSAEGDAFESYVTAAPMDIKDGQVRMDIEGIVPDFLNLSGGGFLTVYTKDKPNSTEVENGPYLIGPSTERVDVRIDGRQAGWKWSRSGAPNTWRMGRMRFDVNPTGGARE